ncbi:MAG: hypothetical protein AB8G05_08315 [Oligoflexales bacterium]
MKQFERFLNITLGLSLFFSMNLFADQQESKDSDEQNRIAMVEYLYSDDQDLFTVPADIDLFPWSKSFGNGRLGSVDPVKKEKDSYSGIHIYRSCAYTDRYGWDADDASLFYDVEDAHMAEDTPKKVEEGYLNTLLMASLMDELY